MRRHAVDNAPPPGLRQSVRARHICEQAQGKLQSLERAVRRGEENLAQGAHEHPKGRGQGTGQGTGQHDGGGRCRRRSPSRQLCRPPRCRRA